MSILPPHLAGPPFPGALGVDPLLGGSLGIGPTGLPPLAGQLPPVGQLPYATPATWNPGGLARQVPLGVGQQASRSALALLPETPAAAAGRAGGLLSRLPSLPKLAPGALSKGTLMRAGGGALVGSLGSSLIDQLNPGGQNSNVEQGLQGAAYGAGIGAAIGTPLFGIGAVPGAALGGLAGGAVGVLSNIFGGGGDDEADVQPVAVLANAIQSAGLDPVTTEQILTTYETQIALAQALEGGEREAAEAAAFDQTGQLILQAMMQQQQAQQQAPVAAANTLALQQQAQQIFEPLAQDITTNANLYAQAMSGIRDQLPESYRAISDATVARELTSADKLANAYRAQAALTPVAQSLTQYQQDNSAYASQLFQQALAQQAAQQTGGGGGAADLNALLQATG